jgi:hypothetical protein
VTCTTQNKTPERGGNDGADGKARKTKNSFPSLSHRALGNRCRDSHIPTAPVTAFPCSQNQQRKEPWVPTFIWSVQAHSSMRKCCRKSPFVYRFIATERPNPRPLRPSFEFQRTCCEFPERRRGEWSTRLSVLYFPTDYGIDIRELASAAKECGLESLLLPEHTHIPTFAAPHILAEENCPELILVCTTGVVLSFAAAADHDIARSGSPIAQELGQLAALAKFARRN